MSFRVNIVCLNSQYVHSSLAPWYLLAGLRAHGEKDIVAKVTEGTVNQTEEALLEEIQAQDWDLVGFCCYVWNISTVISLCEKIRQQNPQCQIVLGGPEVGFTPQDTLQRIPFADYVISGAGEVPFCQLCNRLARGESPNRVGGLTSRTFSHPPLESGEPPSPYTPEYFQVLGGRMAYLETMRGCPYSCAFCLSGRKEPLVFFSMERVKNDLLLLCNSGTRTVKLVDRSFNADPQRAQEIVDFLVACRREGSIPSEVCIHLEMEAMTLTQGLISRLGLAPAGMFRLEVGVQSLHPPTLRAVCRRDKVERLQEKIGALTAFGTLLVHADLIVGLPYEGMAQFRRSFNGLFALSPQEIQVGFLKVLQGTPMRNTEKYPMVYSPLPPYEVQETPWMKTDEIVALRGFAHWVEKLFNRGRFCFTLSIALSLFETPFDFFFAFAQSVKASCQGLDEITDALYGFLVACGAEESRVFDALIKDRLSVCADRLSPLLKQAVPKHINPKRILEQRVGKSRGRRGAALLSDGNTLVFCDYDGGRFCRRDPLTGRYDLFYASIEKSCHS